MRREFGEGGGTGEQGAAFVVLALFLFFLGFGVLDFLGDGELLLT